MLILLALIVLAVAAGVLTFTLWTVRAASDGSRKILVTAGRPDEDGEPGSYAAWPTRN